MSSFAPNHRFNPRRLFEVYRTKKVSEPFFADSEMAAVAKAIEDELCFTKSSKGYLPVEVPYPDQWLPEHMREAAKAIRFGDDPAADIRKSVPLGDGRWAAANNHMLVSCGKSKPDADRSEVALLDGMAGKPFNICDMRPIALMANGSNTPTVQCPGGKFLRECGAILNANYVLFIHDVTRAEHWRIDSLNARVLAFNGNSVVGCVMCILDPALDDEANVHYGSQVWLDTIKQLNSTPLRVEP